MGEAPVLVTDDFTLSQSGAFRHWIIETAGSSAGATAPRRAPTKLQYREDQTMPVIDISKAPVKTGSIYPAPYDTEMAGRSSIRLGEAGGLTQFGVNLVILKPGAKSSLRHWHLSEDEFVMVTQGVCTLVDDNGRHEMGVGDCAAFPAGDANGHHFVNETEAEARFLVVGTKAPRETATYSDIDLKVEILDGQATFTRKDGSPYRGRDR